MTPTFVSSQDIPLTYHRHDLTGVFFCILKSNVYFASENRHEIIVLSPFEESKYCVVAMTFLLVCRFQFSLGNTLEMDKDNLGIFFNA